ncbi:MAG TPA: glycoside hydrolase family 15 protein [Oculatellaceae cyanobacterium]
MPTLKHDNIAFGAPGIEPRWTAARKQAVGTAYSSSSRIWFTIWRGILTEVYYPTVDRAQIRDLQFLITDGESFFHEEKRNLHPDIEALPHCLGYKIAMREHEGRYTLHKTIISDPHLPSIIMQCKLECADTKLASRLKLYVLCAPHVGGGGRENNAHIVHVNGNDYLTANKGNTWLALGASEPFSKTSCGYVGHSDGWMDLDDNYQMDWTFDSAVNGNVSLTGELSHIANKDFVLTLAFGHGAHSAVTTLLQTQNSPFKSQLERFTTQWQRAAKNREDLGVNSSDNGRLYSASYKILMAHEDKLNPGALIASMSIPWGEAKGDEDLGGYHLVWPRDMVNSATGLLAAGNKETPQRALIFLAASQRADGSFPQNFWISGDPYWEGLQLDEVSFPILLAWKLHNENAILGFDPYEMVRRAAGFLVLNGPVTQQDRWEEVGGYSPSTLAANIASLICAAAFSRLRGDSATAGFLEDYADYLRCHIEAWTVTTRGRIHPEVSEHFIRVNPIRSADQNVHPNEAKVSIANRPPGTQVEFEARDIVDAGFLELVRYGIFSADDPLIVNSLKVVDKVLKCDTPFGPAWRRYNNDGYGQQADGSPFVHYGVGRPWPLLTGERAHYELAAGRNVSSYIKALEQFASPMGPLPEQVWDEDDNSEYHLYKGRPTGSAMPLAWAHAEYIKLLRSVRDGCVYDLIPQVYQRYVAGEAVCKLIEIWRMNWQVPSVRRGHILRIQADRSFKLHWSFDGWETVHDSRSVDTALGIAYVDLDIGFQQTAPIQFTFFWFGWSSWEGRNFEVQIKS